MGSISYPAFDGTMETPMADLLILPIYIQLLIGPAARLTSTLHAALRMLHVHLDRVKSNCCAGDSSFYLLFTAVPRS